LSKKKKLPQIIKEIRSFEPGKINYAYQKNISYSQISMYSQCPKKWSLNYRDGHKQYEQSIHMTFGTALHETLQHYLDVVYNISGAEADRIDLIEYFEERLRENYAESYKKNNTQHYSTPDQLREFFEDGVEIINFIKKKRNSYFSKKGWYLAGCEIPIMITPNIRLNNVIYQGFIDVVLYHEPTNTFKIIDIKTSTKGWGAKEKKDELKAAQLVLYKKYFSEQFKVPIDNISIEFFIVRRKVWESPDYPIGRVQIYTPASGRNKLNKSTKLVEEFISECFDSQGHSEKEHHPKINNNCKWCSFNKTHLCSATFE
jgi:hypothetical protein